MADRGSKPSGTTSGERHAEPAVPTIIADAGRQLRAPWAASIAGLLFAFLFTAGLLLLRSQPMLNASNEELTHQFATGQDLAGVIGGLYLAPIAGIMLLWFIAVVRDQIGEREDRFFATVFFGSGLLFVAIEFAATAVASTPIVGVATWGKTPRRQRRSSSFVRSRTRCCSPSGPVRPPCS